MPYTRILRNIFRLMSVLYQAYYFYFTIFIVYFTLFLKVTSIKGVLIVGVVQERECEHC